MCFASCLSLAPVQKTFLIAIGSVCVEHSGDSLVEVVSGRRLLGLPSGSADIPQGRLDKASSGAAVFEGHSSNGLAAGAVE